MMRAVGKSDRGRIRESNQDQFTIIREKDCLFAVVCDGIGGHAGGGRASKIIVTYLRKYFKDHPAWEDITQTENYVVQLLKNANTHLYHSSLHDPQYKGMGTTLVGLLMTPHGTLLVNVGDSRAYGLLDDSLVLLSEDHSYVNELVKLGKIDEEQAKFHPYRNMLTNALGIAEVVKVDVKVIDQPYSTFLLCSDGLHGYVEEEVILETMLYDQSATKKVELLIKRANDVGGFDNVTIVVISDVLGDAL